MSKKPWKAETRAKHGFAPKPLTFGGNGEGPKTTDILPGVGGPAIPPPLPPLSPLPSSGPSAPAGATSPSLTGGLSNAPALKIGLGKAFKSACNAIPAWLPVDMEPVADEEGELWGEFALPVLEKYIPAFKESPEYALIIVSIAIVGGKIRKRKNPSEVTNVGNTSESSLTPT